MMTNDKVLVITGPTATGKTALSVLLARELDGEVVSADSMQVYRGMDIGTAKPSAAEMAGVPHHMLDVAEPDEPFSVVRYVELASKCIDGILSRGKIPIIAGGTGLYIESLIKAWVFSPRDDILRGSLDRRYDEEGAEVLYAELKDIDPKRAEKLSPADKKRIIRAIEVSVLTGKTLTEYDEETAALPPRYDAVTWALSFADRSILYARIDRRVDEMLDNGLLSEVKDLMERLPENATSMQAIGYKELVRAIRGTVTLADAVEAVKRESRRYAKRQLTWLRRRSDVNWLLWDTEPPDFPKALDRIRQYVSVAP